MYDIVNLAQNLTLPVVAINITSVTRDSSRIFNKLDNIYNFSNERESRNVKMPIPVNIEVSMSILTRYMEDMDQILSNFIPFTNPYIILSWKEPMTSGETIEIRSEVLWNDTINLTSPVDTTYAEKIRIVADTSFTIKGWIFKTKNEAATPIYFIDTNYTIVNKIDTLLYEPLSTRNTYTESFKISGYPTVTNVFYNTAGSIIPIETNLTLNQTLSNTNSILLYGNNYQYTTSILLSSSNPNITSGYTSVSTARMGSVSGFKLPKTYYQILNTNMLAVNVPYLSGIGKFNIVVLTPAGYATTYDSNQSNFNSIG